MVLELNNIFSVRQVNLSNFDAPLRYGVLSSENPHQPVGRILFYVPGLGGSIKMALGFLDKVITSGAYDAVIGVDLPGFCLNEHLPYPNPNDYHQILSDFINHPDIKPLLGANECHLCAISLGCCIALQLSQEHHGLFETMTLLAPAFKGHRYSFPGSFQLKALLKLITGGPKATIRLKYGLSVLTRQKEVLDDPNSHFEPLTLPVVYLLALEWLTASAYGLTRSVHIPTLMFVPGSDLVCDPNAMRNGFERLPVLQKKKIEYAEGYHDLFLEPEMPEMAEHHIDWVQAQTKK